VNAPNNKKSYNQDCANIQQPNDYSMNMGFKSLLAIAIVHYPILFGLSKRITCIR